MKLKKQSLYKTISPMYGVEYPGESVRINIPSNSEFHIVSENQTMREINKFNAGFGKKIPAYVIAWNSKFILISKKEAESNVKEINY